MKPIVLLPPALAIAAAAIWLGTQHRSLSAVEDSNTTLRQRIQEARHAEASGESSKTAAANKGKNGKTTAKKIDWKDLASKQKAMQGGNNMPDMRAMIELQKTLMDLSAEDLATHLDEIAALDIPDDAKRGLEGMIIGLLAQKNPELVMERFGDRLNDERGGFSWQISQAFQQWASKDSTAATAWLDAQVASGKLDSKSLDGKSDARLRLEGGVIASLLESDPAAAAKRLAGIPENQRSQIFQGGMFFNTKPGSEKAVADLIRSSVPENQRNSTLANSASMLIHQGGYDKVGEYLTKIEASPAEREAIVAQSLQSKVQNSRDSAKMEAAVEEGRAWALKQSPEAADRITGKALGDIPDFKKGAELALKYQEQTGNDDVLIAFIESGRNRHPNEANDLVAKISDPQKREELNKRLTPQPVPTAE
ncbi:hypothetical protein [Luteolibacter sp. Populi]|uniref:hypothetical protein n=1 Tax=Luteolibacter sp. Populi TaxID=3230487 RepID=UPI003466571D